MGRLLAFLLAARQPLEPLQTIHEHNNNRLQPLHAHNNNRLRGLRKQQQRTQRLSSTTNRSVFALASAALALADEEVVGGEIDALARATANIDGDESLRGRRAADAAVAFARAGVADPRLFEALERRFIAELERVAATGAARDFFVTKEDCFPADSRHEALDFGAKRDGLDNCRAVLHAFERLRASGGGGARATDAARRAMRALLPSEGADDLRRAADSLGDDAERPGLWLWRRENRDRKRRRFFRGAADAAPLPAPPAWRDLFEDCARPLYLDLGCGLGLSALGAAERFPEANVVGVDASPSLVAHARARKSRAGLSNVAFVVADAVAAADAAAEYPGPVAVVAAQFPTPFRGDPSEAVPGARRDAWLVTPRLAESVARGGGALLVKTQVEACGWYAADVCAAAGLARVDDAAYALPPSETERACAALDRPVFVAAYTTCS